MKRKTIFLILIVSLAFFPALTKESPKTLLSRLPDRIGVYEKVDITEYPEKELGASINYVSPGVSVVSLYLYDQGVRKIPDGVDSQLIIESKNGAKNDIIDINKTGPAYRNLTLESDRIALLEIGKRTLVMFYISYIGEIRIEANESVPCYTEIYIAGYKNYICKVRITRARDTSAIDTRNFVASLLSYL